MQSPRSRDEMLSKFWIQRRALQVSSQQFDNGEIWEAERLATAVCNLLHDTRRSRSIVGGHLNLFNNMAFLSGALKDEWPPPGLPELKDMPKWIEATPACGFVGLNSTPDGQYFAPLFDKGDETLSEFSWLPFNKWWTEVVFTTRAEQTIRRGELVLILRDKDGGSHIDAFIDHAAYNCLAHDAVPGATVGDKPFQEIHYVIMRQIAWEVEKSLERFNHLFV